MMNNVHLCPCCAAHLRVPAELHIMRCNACDADLVWLDRGGVRGLALVPPPVEQPPYTDPVQWQRRSAAKPLDAPLFVNQRREAALAALGRRRAFWAAAFWFCAILFVAAAGSGLGGFASLLRHPGRDAEAPVIVMLLAVVTSPLLSYVALYFHGRARLLAENMRRYRQ